MASVGQAFWKPFETLISAEILAHYQPGFVQQHDMIGDIQSLPTLQIELSPSQRILFTGFNSQQDLAY
ncbi:hypothetical protein D3C80_1652550 [compost metagenome]